LSRTGALGEVSEYQQIGQRHGDGEVFAGWRSDLTI
jgi:hypothetical protein